MPPDCFTSATMLASDPVAERRPGQYSVYFVQLIDSGLILRVTFLPLCLRPMNSLVALPGGLQYPPPAFNVSPIDSLPCGLHRHTQADTGKYQRCGFGSANQKCAHQFNLSRAAGGCLQFGKRLLNLKPITFYRGGCNRSVSRR